MRANMGSGASSWGEIRVDLNKDSSANVIADLQALPFIDEAFCDVRCIQALEHVPDWRSALLELLRVTRRRLIVEIPMNSDIRFTDPWRILFPTPENVKLFLSIPERSREHLWQIDPWILHHVMLEDGFCCADPEKLFKVAYGMPSRSWRLTAWRDAQ